YDRATSDNEPVTWVHQKNEYTLSLLCTEFDSFTADCATSASGSTRQSTPASIHSSRKPRAAHTSSDLKDEWVRLLNIPGHVIKNISNPPLLLAFEKYKHYCQASNTLDTMRSDGSRPDNCHKPTATELIEIFVAKSTWYSAYRKAFSEVARNYPDMQAYLDGEDSCPSDQEIWGYNQPEGYSLTDLNKWLAEKKEVKRGKDKGKEKPKGSDTTKSKKKNSDGKKESRK
ncbi:hypothetical protein K443DRAFT_107478, partial [Laccaria amethystina LaAM-08-1]